MSQISQFLHRTDNLLGHFCPACRDIHAIPVDKPDPLTGAWWEWDGHIVAPTLKPSVIFRAMKGRKIVSVCHYTLVAGELEYQKDCTHALRGITMALPALPEYLRERCLIF